MLICLVGGRIDAHGDLVTDWNSLLLSAIRNETTAPPQASRNLAIFHTAIYDAANSITLAHQPYYFNPGAPVQASMEAAMSAAAHQVAVNLYPSQAATFDSFYAASMARIADGPLKSSGSALGFDAANSILGWRAGDGASTIVPYVPSTEPGAWRRTPPLFRPPESPHWRYVTPFAMTSATQFRPPGPPALTSAQYTADYIQVMTLGAANSTVRTAGQTETAFFWSDFSYTVTPPGHWNQIAQNVAMSSSDSLEENARTFALLNIAMADAAILVWESKYEHNFWRPVTAIQQGDSDGNPDTVGDPNWTSLLATPAFPEYVSGHSAFSAAAAVVLSQMFGSNVTFSITSDSLPGVVRTYDSFFGAADEVAWSRIYGGIHFYSADVDGLTSGRELGEYVVDAYLLPIPEPSTPALVLFGGVLLLSLRARRAASQRSRSRLLLRDCSERRTTLCKTNDELRT